MRMTASGRENKLSEGKRKKVVRLGRMQGKKCFHKVVVAAAIERKGEMKKIPFGANVL